MSQVRLVYCTFPSAQAAESAARALVETRAAACVSVLPGVRSVYRWQGEVCAEDEVMIIAKTTAERFPALRQELWALHSYDCPEIVAVPIEDGHEAYLAWVGSETKSS